MVSKSVEVGDLVRFKSKLGVPLHRVGVVIGREEVDRLDEFFRVVWSKPDMFDREWFRAVELKVLSE